MRWQCRRWRTPSPEVAGLYVDNSMQLGMPWPSQGVPWHSLALQRGSAQLQRQIGQAMLAQHPGKRTLLSVLQIQFIDNQPPAPAPACDWHPAACGFVPSGSCDRQPTAFWVDAVAQTKAWGRRATCAAGTFVAPSRACGTNVRTARCTGQR